MTWDEIVEFEIISRSDCSCILYGMPPFPVDGLHKPTQFFPHNRFCRGTRYCKWEWLNRGFLMSDTVNHVSLTMPSHWVHESCDSSESMNRQRSSPLYWPDWPLLLLSLEISQSWIKLAPFLESFDCYFNWILSFSNFTLTTVFLLFMNMIIEILNGWHISYLHVFLVLLFELLLATLKTHVNGLKIEI